MVVDRATLEARANAYASALGADHVFYAAKAFCASPFAKCSPDSA